MLPINDIVYVHQDQRPGCLDHRTIERCAEDVLLERQNESSAEAAHIRGCTECFGDLLLEILALGVKSAELEHG